MQVLIVGDFKSGADAGFQQDDASGAAHCNDKVLHFTSAGMAMKKIKSGLEADLIICCAGTDMQLMQSGVAEYGSTAVKIFQASETGMSADTDFKNSSSSKKWHESTSWLGDEKDPLRLGQSLVELEKAAILQTLTHCGGNRTYAADILGISSRTLRNKLQQYSAEGCTITTPRVRHTPPVTYSEMSGKLLS